MDTGMRRYDTPTSWRHRPQSIFAAARDSTMYTGMRRYDTPRHYAVGQMHLWVDFMTSVPACTHLPTDLYPTHSFFELLSALGYVLS